MYVPLDVNFPDDDKVIAVGLEGAGLYAQALCVAKRLEKDGRLSWAHLRRLGAADELIESLITVGLLSEDDDGLWITAWLAHNLSQDEIDEKRSSDAKRKRLSRKNRPNGREEASERTPESVRVDADGASEDVRALEIETETQVETQQQQDTDVRSTNRDETIDAAVDLLLRRTGAYETARTKQNPTGWLNAARAGKRKDHWQKACELWAQSDEYHAPGPLASALEPLPAATVRLAEYVAEQPEVDKESNLAGIDSVRGSLRKAVGE